MPTTPTSSTNRRSISVMPKQGDKVYVNGRSYTKNGLVLGIQKDKEVVQHVRHVYGDGAIRTTSGDKWTVKRYRDGWISVV